MIHNKKTALAIALTAVSTPWGTALAAGTCTPVTNATTGPTSVANAAAPNPALRFVSLTNAGVLCKDGNSDLTVSSDLIFPAAAPGVTTGAIYVEGLGNTVNIGSGVTVSNAVNSGNVTTNAIFLGDYTVSRFSGSGTTSTTGMTDVTSPTGGTGKNLSLVGTGTQAGLGAVGNNKLILSKTDLSAAGITSADQLVGKTIKMNGVVVDGEARAGETRVITAYDPATGIITVNRAWREAQAGKGFNIIAGSGKNVLNNEGTISATYSGTTAASTAVRAIDSSVAGSYEINNLASGTIRAAHTSVGTAQAIQAGGDVTSLTVNNSGTIEAVRTNGSLTLTTNNSATALKATGGSITNQTLGSTAAIFSQEETATVSITNQAGGILRGVGDFAPAIYLRSEQNTILNAGLIEGSKNGSNFGLAIVLSPDAGADQIRSTKIENSGTIKGDIVATSANGLRWYALSKFSTSAPGTALNYSLAETGDATALGLVNASVAARLNISNQFGQGDSTIRNSGSILGGIYYGNGTHSLTNSGTLTGDIDLDQRRVTPFGSTVTINGTKSFTFENSGSFSGTLVARTESRDGVTSSITLAPTVTGSGGTAAAPNTSNIKGFNGIKIIHDGTADAPAVLTVAPKVQSGVVVRDGEVFQVATAVKQGTALDTLSAVVAGTAIETKSNGLVSWEGSIDNASGRLVIEAEVDAARVKGTSDGGRGALASITGFDNALGSQVQNLETEEEVRKAAEQLRPSINGGAFQATSAATGKVLGLVDARSNSANIAALTGKSGIATGDQPDNVGMWFQGFGFNGGQDRRKGVDGYNADAYGFAVGADTLVGEGGSRIGAALSYARSNVNEKGDTTGNRNDIDSYQATLYGSRLMDGWYLSGAVALGRHTYDSRRVVLGNSVTGGYDAWQYSARAEAGAPIQLSKVTLTPVVGATYSHLDQDSYTESGTGALSIGSVRTDSFRSALGAVALVPIYRGKVNTDIEFRGTWNHEFADTNQNMTARFVGGGAAFSANGVAQSRDSANLGVSLVFSGVDRNVAQSLRLTYNAEAREGYLGHVAVLQGRWDF